MGPIQKGRQEGEQAAAALLDHGDDMLAKVGEYGCDAFWEAFAQTLSSRPGMVYSFHRRKGDQNDAIGSWEGDELVWMIRRGMQSTVVSDRDLRNWYFNTQGEYPPTCITKRQTDAYADAMFAPMIVESISG